MLLDEWLSVGDWDWEDDVSSRTRAEVCSGQKCHRALMQVWGSTLGDFLGWRLWGFGLKGYRCKLHRAQLGLRGKKNYRVKFKFTAGWKEWGRGDADFTGRLNTEELKKNKKKTHLVVLEVWLSLLQNKEEKKQPGEFSGRNSSIYIFFFFFCTCRILTTTLIVKRKMFVFCHYKVNN